jgi:hypothetical protein
MISSTIAPKRFATVLRIRMVPISGGTLKSGVSEPV